ncbi:hypothetical protein GCM10010174_15550 [Kutzneria viridogrisea]
MIVSDRAEGGASTRLVVLLALLLAVLSAAGVWVRATGPSDGTVINNADVLLSNGALVVREDLPGRELLAGDVLVSVDGHELAQWLAHGIGGEPVAMGQRVDYEVLRGGHTVHTSVLLHPFDLGGALLKHWSLVLLMAMLVGTSVFVYRQRPGNPAAVAALITSMFAAASGITNGVVDLQAIDLVGGDQFWRWWLAELAAGPILGGMLHLTLVFPEPNTIRRLRRWTALVYAGPTLLYLVSVGTRLPLARTPLERLEVLGQPLWLVQYVYTPLILIMLVRTYRVAPDQLTRHRLRWLALTLGGGQGLYLLLWILPHQLTGSTPLGWPLVHLVFIPIPIALAAAILRYNALDIDIVLGRSLLYTALSVGVIGIYLGVVGLLNAFAQPLDEPWRQIAAATVVVVLGNPLRTRLQSAINQWLFGDRDDPYRVVSTLAATLESSHLPASLLGAVVETVGTALRLPYVAIEHSGEHEPAAGYGTPAGELARFPLVYQGSLVGTLVAASRTPREPLRRRDRRALTEIARHAGAAVYSARVTEDLQRSRDRLVRAREEERRRLLHDLHDGVGPTLAAVALGLSLAESAVDSDADSAKALMGTLAAELQGAIGEIRRVAADLRPTALERLGLVSALHEHVGTLVERLTVAIEIDAPEQLPTLPAAVEVAAYRIACEALTNVTRHAHADRCRLRLWVDRDLHLEVTDDGTGLVGGPRTGVGLSSMGERAAELGGQFHVAPLTPHGTRVLARLPLTT